MSERLGWLARLRAGLAKSSSRLVDGIAGALSRRRLDSDAVEALEDVLITADMGPATAAKLAAKVAASMAGYGNASRVPDAAARRGPKMGFSTSSGGTSTYVASLRYRSSPSPSSTQ